MTPAEANEIDRLEFEAECAAIRQRAYALIRHTPTPSPKPTRHVVAAKVSEDKPIARRRQPKPRLQNTFAVRYYTALGKRLSLNEWAAETGFSVHTIRNRLGYGWTIERAVTERPKTGRRGRGVVFNFPPVSGTGAGSTAQETPEITFSEEANS
ncbi:hypothetical protein [Bosea sp. 47.2.35]|uniref:hypothetical protein n=1 Tax=Bosea sp. 47.2.35 TaxID=2969304 RepID=UPI0021500221|nr:hypothetical protein [Bosea sp. 47.2.35]MCR4520960.1 hypothetical protein [Bosea sp. 47.2.35]